MKVAIVTANVRRCDRMLSSLSDFSASIHDQPAPRWRAAPCLRELPAIKARVVPECKVPAAMLTGGRSHLASAGGNQSPESFLTVTPSGTWNVNASAGIDGLRTTLWYVVLDAQAPVSSKVSNPMKASSRDPGADASTTMINGSLARHG